MRRSWRDRDERGAVAVLVGLLMAFVLIAIAAFTLDLGMQRNTRRDMQALADVVALDVARLLDGRRRNDIQAGSDGRPSLQQALADSVLNNDSTTLGDGIDCGTVGYATDAAAMTSAGSSCVYAYLVRLDDDPDGDGLPYPTNVEDRPQNVGNSPAVPDGVVIVARSTVDFAFGLAESGTATRTAVATSAAPTLCFSLGTTALALDTSEGALSPVLAGLLQVDADVLGPSGVADLQQASVPLVDLAVELGAGSPDALLTTDVGLDTLTAAAVTVLERQGDTLGAEALTLVTANVGALPPVTLGSILDLETGTPLAALTADVSVLSLLTAHAFAANGTNALGVTIPGLADVRVIEPPTIACGAAGVEARSAQVRLRLEPTLATDLLPESVSDVDVAIDLEAGHGLATLTDLQCRPPSATFDISSGVVVMPPAGGEAGLSATVEVGLLVAADVTAQLKSGVATTTETGRVITFPAAPALPSPVSVPEGGASDTLNLYIPPGGIDAEASLLGLLGLSLGELVDLVRPALNGVVDVADAAITPILNQLSEALGVRLGVADLEMLGHPQCNSVRLIG